MRVDEESRKAGTMGVENSIVADLEAIKHLEDIQVAVVRPQLKAGGDQRGILLHFAKKPSNPIGALLLEAVCLGVLLAASATAQEFGPPLPGTKPLTATGDLASEMVAGADRFLLKQIEESASQREKHWKRDFSSAEAYRASVEPNRKRLAHILGVRDVAGGEREDARIRLIGWPWTWLMMMRCEPEAIESRRQHGPRSEM